MLSLERKTGVEEGFTTIVHAVLNNSINFQSRILGNCLTVDRLCRRPDFASCIVQVFLCQISYNYQYVVSKFFVRTKFVAFTRCKITTEIRPLPYHYLGIFTSDNRLF